MGKDECSADACTRSGAPTMRVRRAKVKKIVVWCTLRPHGIKTNDERKTVETRHADGSEFYHYGRTGIREGKETAYCSCAAIYAIGTQRNYKGYASVLRQNDPAAMERPPMEPFESPFVPV